MGRLGERMFASERAMKASHIDHVIGRVAGLK